MTIKTYRMEAHSFTNIHINFILEKITATKKELPKHVPQNTNPNLVSIQPITL